MKWIERFLVGVWEFVVGDDWRTALGVALTLGMVAAFTAVGIAAWWLMPPAVLALLAISLWRATDS